MTPFRLAFALLAARAYAFPGSAVMTPFRLAFALLAARADAFPGSASDQQLLACSGGNCPAMHGQIPQLGNALNAAGKADGGTCATSRFEPRGSA